MEMMRNGVIGLTNGGISVIVSDMLPLFKDVQYRFPKTRRKRILKKWAANHMNYRQVENNDGYMVGGNFICNSRVAAQLKSSGGVRDIF